MVFAAGSGTRRSASVGRIRPRPKARTAEVNVRATVRTNGVASAVATRLWDMQQADKSIRVRNAGEKTAFVARFSPNAFARRD